METSNVPEKTYPTTPDVDGFFYADEQEEHSGILTKEYENGNQVKKVAISGGRTAIVRELLAKDILDAYKIAGNTKDSTQVNFAMISLSTKIDDATIFVDEIGKMKGRDFTKIMAANAGLNF